MTTAPTFSPMLEPGDPAPWFRAPMLGGDPAFPFDKLGGRHVLLLLFGSAAVPATATALRTAAAAYALFDGRRAAFCGISVDATDVSAGRIAADTPGLTFFLDHDHAVSARFGAAIEGSSRYRPHWLLLDPRLAVAARFALADGALAIAALAEAARRPEPEGTAPVLEVPRVLEPAICRALIEAYEQHGGVDSGVMRQVGEKTVLVLDHTHKRRFDHEIVDEGLREAIRARVGRRLVPMIARAFHFNATRIERYMVACYDAATEGHFNPHRDNTTLGTAHRRFAVTINLNADYDGGDLRFPEYGTRTYRAPPGGAIVFSCSMQHEATRVTAGRRFATLPFLYDDAAAAVRQANLGALAPAEPVTAAR